MSPLTARADPRNLWDLPVHVHSEATQTGRAQPGTNVNKIRHPLRERGKCPSRCAQTRDLHTHIINVARSLCQMNADRDQQLCYQAEPA